MKKLKVRLKESGEIAFIREDEFDEALHERVAATVGDMDPDEFAKRSAEAMAGALGPVLKELGVGKAKRERIVNKPGDDTTSDIDDSPFPERTMAYGSALRCTPAWEGRYRGLPEWERKMRTPESDVHCWRYLKAIVEKDRATLMELRDFEHAQAVSGVDPKYAQDVQRALSVGTPAEGGFLAPAPLANLFVVKRDKRERIAPRAMTLTSAADTLSIPVEATVGAVAGVAEGVAIGETDSTFGEVLLTKKKAGRRVRSSRELVADMSAAFSLVNILTNQFARRMAAYMDLQAAEDGDGVGTNHTDALIEASIATATASGGAFTRVKLMILFHSLPSEWREGGGVTWMGNASVIEIIGNLLDTADRPLYQGVNEALIPVSEVGPNVVSIVEGIPLIEVPFATDILMIGLLSEGFAVLRDEGVRIESTTEGDGAFEEDRIVWKVIERRDSAVIQVDAFRKTDAVIT